jgi:hypothetical protein
VTPRLYLDEDVVPALARMLRSHGAEVEFAQVAVWVLLASVVVGAVDGPL